MPRKLTSEEEAFLRARLREGGATSVTFTPEATIEVTKKQGVKRRKRVKLFHVRTYSLLVLSLPLLLTLNFVYALSKVRTVVGEDGLAYLEHHGLSPLVKEQAASGGFAWLEDFVTLYQQRYYIIGGSFAAAFLIVGFLYLVRYYLDQRAQALEGEGEDRGSEEE